MVNADTELAADVRDRSSSSPPLSAPSRLAATASLLGKLRWESSREDEGGDGDCDADDGDGCPCLAARLRELEGTRMMAPS